MKCYIKVIWNSIFITILIQVKQYSCIVNKVTVKIAKPCLLTVSFFITLNSLKHTNNDVNLHVFLTQ